MKFTWIISVQSYYSTNCSQRRTRVVKSLQWNWSTTCLTSPCQTSWTGTTVVSCASAKSPSHTWLAWANPTSTSRACCISCIKKNETSFTTLVSCLGGSALLLNCSTMDDRISFSWICKRMQQIWTSCLLITSRGCSTCSWASYSVFIPARSQIRHQRRQ